MNKMTIKRLIAKTFPPNIIVPLAFYLFCDYRKREIIRSDVKRWCELMRIDRLGFFQSLSYLLIFEKSFRNLYYKRVGSSGIVLQKLFRGERTLFITSLPIGEGFFIRHGYSTFVNTLRIGKNCTVHQNVTIGDNGKGGIPIIGDNVTICTGAIVIGDIKIGNNVIIGAGAIVVDDVPDNSTVVGPKALVIKR